MKNKPAIQSLAVPFVPVLVSDKQAKWFGQYTINCATSDAVRLGAPFKLESQAQSVCDKLNLQSITKG